MALKRTLAVMALLLAAFSAEAQEETLLPMPGGSQLHVIYYGDNIVRLFHDPSGGEVREPQATPPASIIVPDAKKPANNPRIKVYADGGRISVEESGRVMLWMEKPVLYEDGKTTLRFKDGGGHRYYGGGVQNGRFAHAGKSIAIENQNSWTDGGVSSPAPWFWSTAGYGMLWNTFRKGKYTFGDQVELSHDTPYLDLFIFVDKEPVALLRDYYQLTGNPVLLPKFGFYEGHLNAYNRDWWAPSTDRGILFEDGKRYVESQKDNGGIKESLNGELPGNYQFSARAVVDRYQTADMPLGWILPNDGYGAGYGQATTLEGNIQNLKEFGDYARLRGVEIGLWTQSDLHPVDSLPALLQRDIEAEVGTAGVRVLKTDVAWVGWGYSFGLNGIADAASIMSRYARPFIITLDGWAGTQRYGGIWTGDQTGGQWEYIRFHIPTYIGAGLSGQPNVGSDMDGIFGGGNELVNIRDFQWKTFSPMELNMDGWGANEKYPQALGERAEVINRKFLKLKSVLMPYTYTIAHEAVTGLPMIRAISLEYPDAPDALTQYEYMYGPSFLVAPIYKETAPDQSGNDIRNDIYLPKGLWMDYFTDKEYSGGVILNSVDAPLDRIPVFVKRGAIIPVTSEHNNPSRQDHTTRIYEVYPYGRTSFTEYDDDGRSLAYLSGDFTSTLIEQALDGNTASVTIYPTMGSYGGLVRNKATEIRFHTAAKPAKVKAFMNGKKTSVIVTYANGIASVVLPKADVTSTSVTVRMTGFVPPAKGLAVPESQLAGASEVPEVITTPDAVLLRWKSVAAGDEYRELEFRDILYTNIKTRMFRIEGLEPDTDYSLRVRDFGGEWTALHARTLEDPLANAVKGISGSCTALPQHGQEIDNLFDLSTDSEMWHTQWFAQAVPFTVTADLGLVYQLDYLEYVPRQDAGNGTILNGTVSTSLDGTSWSDPILVNWVRNGDSKRLELGGVKARFVRLDVDDAVGDFGSGRELFIFKVPGTDGYKQGVFNERGEAVESL